MDRQRVIVLSETHELTVFGTAEVKLTKNLDRPEQISEMSDHVNNSEWRVQYTPDIDFYRCSCGEQFHTDSDAELHLMKNGEDSDKKSGEEK